MDRVSYSPGMAGEFVDTRSPAEYCHDHIPGAASIPILDDEERAVVGTLYKKDRESALARAMEFYGRRLEGIRESLRKAYRSRLVVYCWRGGLRSKTITELALGMDLRAVQLDGGYKQYRKYVREALAGYSFSQKFVVLHGLTGVGKTELLSGLSCAVDLEGLAQHRSSVFGSVGLQPRSQKMFESLLLQRLHDVAGCSCIAIEGESKKIGSIFVPDAVCRAMAQGIHVLVTLDIGRRVERTVSSYLSNPLHIRQTMECLPRIEKQIGKKRATELCSMLRENRLDEFAFALLTEYYDPLYMHSIGRLKYSLTIENSDVRLAQKKLLKFCSAIG